jgi:2-polyprenyl-3-methyl-5-hydroxy-6-metoxy-1,4-benzoquinol methylase
VKVRKEKIANLLREIRGNTMTVDLDIDVQGVYLEGYVDLIEFAYGEGFLSAGGSDTMNLLFEDIDLNGKKILDIGCGIGGVDFYLASNYDCEITAIDVEPYVIERAELDKDKQENLKGSVNFHLCQDVSTLNPGSYDIVFSKEVFLHIKDKESLFNSISTLLKPGGKLRIIDWALPTLGYTQELSDYLEFDHVSAFLISTASYIKALEESGFVDITSNNITPKVIEHTDNILAMLRQDKTSIDKYGESYVREEYIPSWQMMRDVMENDQLEVLLIKAEKSSE